MKKVLFSILLCLTITGCASNSKSLDSLIGRSIDDVITTWGGPQSVLPRHDGGFTYTWRDRASDVGYNGCRKILTTDNKGKILTWSMNGCSIYTFGSMKP